jgi:hypothetical protein
MDKKGKPEADAELQRERKARGKRREDHLEAGRQRAAYETQAHHEVARALAEQEAALDSEQGSPGSRLESPSA